MISESSYIKPVLKVIGILFLIQAIHSLLVYFFSNFFGSTEDVHETISLILFIIIGVALYFVFKANKNNLSLRVNNNSKKSKLIYLISTLIVIALAISTPIFNGELTYSVLVSLVYSIIVIPIFEELIFRGYVWNYLNNSIKKEFLVYIITTILFALWHLGYVDDILFRVNSSNQTVDLANIMLFKVITGGAFGVVTGFIRFKTKNTYASILAHAFMNIFGR